MCDGLLEYVRTHKGESPCGIMVRMINELILFFAVYPAYIASSYAVIHVLIKHEKKHHLKHIVAVIGSAILGWVVSVLLKNTIMHPRPSLEESLFVPGDVFSFPSGHATFMFALAFAMYGFDRRAGVVLLLLAAATGLARVLSGVHYWYDILGGVFIGAGVASIVYFVLTALGKRS